MERNEQGEYIFTLPPKTDYSDAEKMFLDEARKSRIVVKDMHGNVLMVLDPADTPPPHPHETEYGC